MYGIKYELAFRKCLILTDKELHCLKQALETKMLI
jgi:hypothetical protein